MPLALLFYSCYIIIECEGWTGLHLPAIHYGFAEFSTMDLLSLREDVADDNPAANESAAPGHGANANQALVAHAPIDGPPLTRGKRVYYTTYDSNGVRHRHVQPGGPMSRTESTLRAKTVFLQRRLEACKQEMQISS